MHILFDLRFANDVAVLQRGIGRVAQALLDLLYTDPTITLSYLVNADLPQAVFDKVVRKRPFVECYAIEAYNDRRAYDWSFQAVVNKFLRDNYEAGHFDVLLDPAPVVMPHQKSITEDVPYMVVFYDSILHLFDFKVDWLLDAMQYRIARADGILSISETAWCDFIKLQRSYEPSYQHGNVLNMIPPLLALGMDGVTTRQRGDYILCVSSALPHKAPQDAVSIMAALPKAHRNRYTLVLMGIYHPMTGVELERQAIMSGVNLELKTVVGLEALADLYRNAKALLHPSHYEGLGLPPIEAMLLGTPVVKSDGGALREIAPHSSIDFTYRAGDIEQAALRLTRLLDCNDSAYIAIADAMFDEVVTQYQNNQHALTHVKTLLQKAIKG